MDLTQQVEELAALVGSWRLVRDAGSEATAQALVKEFETRTKTMAQFMRDGDCPFTQSHTRDWCGRPWCRAS